ncbi:MAG TPA: M3 family oligoendopeptidase, partial [Azospirillaceae bacterium]|nr:M3 family oligoendopeptidase [Azospirillaceae bacterium]
MNADAVSSETLPTWDLSDLYPDRDGPAITADLHRATTDAEAFHRRFAGRLDGLSGAELAEAVVEYERIDEILGRLMSYTGLVYAGDQSDPEIGRFAQDMSEKVNNAATSLLFFTLELNRLDEERFNALLAESPALARYAPWLRDVRLYREHQLSDEMEKLLHEKHVVGRSAWARLFDETIAGLRFPIGGKELTCAEAQHLMSDPSPAVRREAGSAISQVLGANIRLFALVTNTLAKDKEIEDKWRRYPHAVSSRNLSNRVEDEVVDALSTAVQAAYPAISHRYYALKAKWFGVEQLDWQDRNAPLPDEDDRRFSWSEARDVVLSAYGRFSPELAAVGRRFFDNPWIDAGVRPGKSPGAFAHPTIPSAHPYLLVNFQGKTRDVMTLAHELGHGVHQVLAGSQGQLLCDTPLTLAETASVFGEMLTFRGLLDAETDAKRRRTMLASKVEDMINTVVRQIAFFEFERRVHAARRDGELTPEAIGDIWFGVQSESLGPAVRFTDEYRPFWSYIPHFIHTPFYVY